MVHCHFPPRIALPRLSATMLPLTDVFLLAAARQHGCEMEEFAPGVAEHIRDIALVLHRKLPQAQILLHALMPRASRFLITEEEPAEFYQQPSIYSPYIAMVNGLLKAFSADWDWATCLDCSNVFLEKASRAPP